MSSIAIITDPNMLEFHRFRGSDSIVFWRLGLKRFSRFDEGDLVFFMDRRQRHPYSSEKGIIGFGRASAIRNRPLHQAWSLYEQRLGYESETNFKEALRYYRKDENTLPQRIQCIELEEIVILRAPVFLSEVDFEVSDRLESFTYLVKENHDLAGDVLEIAMNLGVDPWFQMQNKFVSLDRFAYLKREQALRKQLEALPSLVSRKDANLLKKHTSGVLYRGLYYRLEGDGLHLSYSNIVDIETLFSIYGVQQYLAQFYPNLETTLYLRNPSSSIQRCATDLKLKLVEI